MITPGRLNDVRSLDDLIVFLGEDLDWPVGNITIEDATFDYEPEEIGIDPGRAPRLAKIRELRPLQANQPYFLKGSTPRRDGLLGKGKNSPTFGILHYPLTLDIAQWFVPGGG